MSKDAKTKQKALRRLTNGMCVMTSRSGDRHGVSTVTWVSQASFEPPLLMAVIRKDSTVFDWLVESRFAALRIVDKHQTEIAQKFFSPTKDPAAA